MVRSLLFRRKKFGTQKRRVSLPELTPAESLRSFLLSEEEILEKLKKLNLSSEISGAVLSVLKLARNANLEAAETRSIYARQGAFAHRHCSEQERQKLVRADTLNQVARILAAATGLPERSFFN
ncbi:MAG TPA: hypothetical protein PKA63_08280 [Oligoflexia bacterium]|nr:hypothetical protein [Oligoflexia bacterium]HMP48648.1 hypothetical protein [Oligoflexia bacterium]